MDQLYANFTCISMMTNQRAPFSKNTTNLHMDEQLMKLINGNVTRLTFAGRGVASERHLMAVLVVKKDQTTAVLKRKMSSLKKLPCRSEETAILSQLKMPPKTFANATLPGERSPVKRVLN